MSDLTLNVGDLDNVDVPGEDCCKCSLLLFFCSFSESLELLYWCGLFSVSLSFSLHLFG